MEALEIIERKVTRSEKKYGFIQIPKKKLDFFPKGLFKLVVFGQKIDKKLDNYGRIRIGKALMEKVDEGAIVTVTKVSPGEYHVDFKAPGAKPTGIEVSIHEKIISVWVNEMSSKFGPFKPTVSKNVNINEILPRAIHLKENVKTVDGLCVLKIGELSVYKRVLEVQHKGVREDTVMRVALILPYVDHVDIVGKVYDLLKMKELVERIIDPNIVKARVTFHSIEEYLKLK